MRPSRLRRRPFPGNRCRHPDRRARRVARTGDEIEREYGLNLTDSGWTRSIEEMQANIGNAKAALDATGEFDDDPDEFVKRFSRILHFADQIDRRRTGTALAEIRNP